MVYLTAESSTACIYGTWERMGYPLTPKPKGGCPVRGEDCVWTQISETYCKLDCEKASGRRPSILNNRMALNAWKRELTVVLTYVDTQMDKAHWLVTTKLPITNYQSPWNYQWLWKHGTKKGRSESYLCLLDFLVFIVFFKFILIPFMVIRRWGQRSWNRES